jgi:Zn-dependent protease with chaperone function
LALEETMKLSPSLFTHPEDRAALETLRALPLFPTAVKSFMKTMPEPFLHGMNMANKIRLGPEQLPALYAHLPPICQTLGIAEPELYLEMNPQPNAYTYGDTQTFLTLTSGLVEYLEEDELKAVIAHECGHIACHHVLYHSMADLLIQYGPLVFGPLAPASLPLRLALLYWYRRSELSADRAAAVAMGGHTSVVETMVRLAGGPKSLTAGVNLAAFIAQAERYDALLDQHWDKVLQSFAVMNQSHPFLAVRTREIVHWCAGEDFQRLMEAIAADAARPRCPGCQRPVEPDWKWCGGCGQALPTTPNATTTSKETGDHQ